ncbi:hypothetical protein M5K25_012728 [Dendrobium thyrsiflorum]|uniref:Secreted protein n=1 Tax=Dendrobium thyrsiflorum TaxID=117978 RepID=A0ABD0UXX0_DENTH
MRHVTSCSVPRLGTAWYLFGTAAWYCSVSGDVTAPDSPLDVSYVWCPHRIISPSKCVKDRKSTSENVAC